MAQRASHNKRYIMFLNMSIYNQDTYKLKQYFSQNMI